MKEKIKFSHSDVITLSNCMKFIIQSIGPHFQHIFQVSLLYLYSLLRYKRLSGAGLTPTHTDTQTHTHTQLIWAEPTLERFGDNVLCLLRGGMPL